MRVEKLIILLLVTIPFDNFACICDKVNSRKLFRRADYVFIGTALNNLTPDTVTSQLLDLKGTGARVSFRVEKVLKGNIDRKIIAIIQNGSSCAMLFDLGDKYLVFGQKRDKIFDSGDIYESIISMDSSDTRPDKEIFHVRREEKEQELKYENKIKKEYGVMVDTNLCSCFYETGKTYNKYIRKKRRVGNKD